MAEKVRKRARKLTATSLRSWKGRSRPLSRESAVINVTRLVISDENVLKTKVAKASNNNSLLLNKVGAVADAGAVAEITTGGAIPEDEAASEVAEEVDIIGVEVVIPLQLILANQTTVNPTIIISNSAGTLPSNVLG